MLLPLIERESSEEGSRFRAVIFTVLRWVFICMSTPGEWKRHEVVERHGVAMDGRIEEGGEGKREEEVMVSKDRTRRKILNTHL